MVATSATIDALPILGPLTERKEGLSGPYQLMEGGRGGKVTHYVDTYRLEERTNGKGWVKELPDGRFRVKAKGQHCGPENRNHRRYPVPVWLQHLEDRAPFRLSLATRRVIGHLEHPEDGKSQMPLGAIVVTEALPPDADGEVYIIFETMSTPAGKIVEAYIRSRVGFGLSSRGNGSVISRNGVDEVQMDFEPVTWDCVIQESTIGAEVEALRESWQDRPGTADEFARYLAEARDELVNYVNAVISKSNGDATKARALVEADNAKAASAIDCTGDICKCVITEDISEDVPPSGFSKYLLGFEDESAHYRAYQGTTGQWEVWLHPHNLPAERLASRIPTLDACHQVAENHYRLILTSGAQSAQVHAEQSNAVGQDAASSVPAAVNAPPSAHVVPIAGAGRQMPQIIFNFGEALEKSRPAWAKTLLSFEESFKVQQSMPYSGTVCELETSSGEEQKKANEALRSSGFFCEEIDATHARVYTTFDDEEQARQHIERVLRGKGMRYEQTEAVGIIEDGQVFLEDSMGNLSEYAPDKSAPGPGMAGGDTIPDEPRSASGAPASHADRAITTTSYQGLDPEDLDLDLDVNEDGDSFDYPYDDDTEDEGQKLQRGALTRIQHAPPKGPQPVNPAARKHAGMPEDDSGDDDYDYEDGDDMDDETYEGDDDMDDEHPDDWGDTGYTESDEMSEHELTETPTSRPAQQAMFAKAFGRNDKARNAREAWPKHRKFRAKYAKGHGMDQGKARHLGDRHKKGKKKNESTELAEGPTSRPAQQAMFAKAFGKPQRSIDARDKWPKHRKFRAKYAKARGMNQQHAAHLNLRRKKGKGKKKNESVFVRRDQENILGAVRVFENENGPYAFEFYDTAGILESVFDGQGNARYVAESAEYIDESLVIEDGSEIAEAVIDTRNFNGATEVWENVETGEFVSMFEEELGARHGGKTGVAIKGDAYKGDAGGTYNIGDLPDGGDRGPSGPGNKPGTYDQASEEGEGKHLKKGTWPTSGSPVSGIGSRDGDDDDEDGDGGAQAKKMAEEIEVLESRLAAAQDQIQEQHDELDALRESQQAAELDHARARLFAAHPELRLAEDRFLTCESVEEIRDEANAMLRLVEARAPKPAPTTTTVVPLQEARSEPTLAALTGRANAVTSAQLHEAMNGSLSESILSGGPSGASSRDVGSVTSRTAAARRRRLGRG